MYSTDFSWASAILFSISSELFVVLYQSSSYATTQQGWSFQMFPDNIRFFPSPFVTAIAGYGSHIMNPAISPVPNFCIISCPLIFTRLIGAELSGGFLLSMHPAKNIANITNITTDNILIEFFIISLVNNLEA